MTLKKFLTELNDGGCETFNRLRWIVAKYKPKTILEIGSGWGLSAVSFLYKNDIRLVSIDKIGDLVDFKRRVEGMGVADRIERIVGDSTVVLPERKNEWRGKFDLIYIDGNHQYEGVKKDLLNSLELEPKVIVLDDFFHKNNWNGRYGITRAVIEIVKEKKLKLKVFTEANGFALIWK